MAFTRNAFGALVVYAGAAVAHQRHKATQEQVHFPELGQALQRAFAQQTVIGVIEHHIRSQRLHHFVKALGGGSFEPGVRLALGAHAVHHVHARQVFVDHRVHGVDVVLAVAVDGNGHVGQVLGGHQARQQSVLMAAVAGKADAPVVLVRFSQASDDVPGLILGTVVDEQYAAFVRYLARCGKVFDFFQEHATGQGQHGLFIVTGNHDIQDGVSHWDVLLLCSYGARTLVHPEKRMVQRRFSPWYTMATALGPVFVATAAPSRKVAAGA